MKTTTLTNRDRTFFSPKKRTSQYETVPLSTRIKFPKLKPSPMDKRNFPLKKKTSPKTCRTFQCETEPLIEKKIIF
jgi:hypothetical protein